MRRLKTENLSRLLKCQQLRPNIEGTNKSYCFIYTREEKRREDIPMSNIVKFCIIDAHSIEHKLNPTYEIHIKCHDCSFFYWLLWRICRLHPFKRHNNTHTYKHTSTVGCSRLTTLEWKCNHRVGEMNEAVNTMDRLKRSKPLYKIYRCSELILC